MGPDLKIADTPGDDCISAVLDLSPPIAEFRSLRLVWVEVVGDGELLERFRSWLDSNGIQCPIVALATLPSIRTIHRSFYLPHHARQIEQWLQGNGAERVKMVVDGVEIEP